MPGQGQGRYNPEPEPARKLREGGVGDVLPIGAVLDTEFLRRVGDEIVGAAGVGGGGYDTIQEEGSGLTQRTTLNFVGPGITAADDTTRTTVTLSTATAGAAGVGDSASAGSADSLARSDHAHSFATGSPAALGNAAAAGSSASFPRLDHVHKRDVRVAEATVDVGTRNRLNFAIGGEFDITDDVGNDEVDIQLATPAAPADVSKAAAAAGTADARARADHKHDITTATAGAAGVGDVAAEGSATSLARSDHTHSFATGTPSGLANADTAGVSASFPHLDHQHKRDVRVAEAGIDVGTRNRLNFVIAGEFDILDDLPSDEIDISLTVPGAPADVSKAAAAAGIADARARADHKHDIFTAVAGAAGVGDSASEGSAESLARSDHAHSFATGSPAGLGNAAAAGASASFPRLDHVHKRDIRVAKAGSDVGTRNRVNFIEGSNITITVTDDVGNDEIDIEIAATGGAGGYDTIQEEGSNLTVRTTLNFVGPGITAADDTTRTTVTLTTATAGAAGVAAVAAEGSADSLARSDHAHGFATGIPSDLANANTEGVAASFVRLDHQHKRDVRVAQATVDVGTRNRLNFAIAGEFTIGDDIPGDEIDIQLAAPGAPADVSKAAAAAGTADARARADHKHDIVTAIAGAAGVGDSASEGSVETLARSDHAHSFATGTPAALGNAAAAGASASFPRLDHVHKRDIRVAYNTADVGTRNRLNFLGGGVFVVDDSGGDEVEVTIPSMLVVATAAGATLAASGNPTRTVVTGTNHTYVVLDYPDASTTAGDWHLRLPQDIGTNKTLTVTILWIAESATSGAVTWGAAVLGRTDSDPWDAALGSETTVSTTTDGTAGDLNTTVITLSSSGVDAFDALILRIRRLGGDGGDTMTADARFLMATVEW